MCQLLNVWGNVVWQNEIYTAEPLATKPKAGMMNHWHKCSAQNKMR
jgi:hypothetical protein